MLEGHAWLIPILDDLIEHCDRHSMNSTAVGLRQARMALVSEVGALERLVGDDPQERWLGEVIDELARYCHHQGLDEVETKLLQAQEAWHEECHPPQRGNVLTFPAGLGRREDEAG